MDAVLNDLRYAIRVLRRSPGFAATAILTLALAIGANAAIFSAVQGVLVAPLPYPDPDRLVRVFEETDTTPHFPMSPANFRDYRQELRTFAGLAAYFQADLQVGDAGRPEQLPGMQVTSGFFTLLGHPPVLGRDFVPGDELPERNTVVILSHELWRRRFGGDPAVIGRPMKLSGRTFEIVGVLPAGFQHVGGTFRSYGHGERVDIWWVLPVPQEERRSLRFSHYFNVVGRVRPGVAWADVSEDIRQAGASAATRYPEPNSPWRGRIVPLKDEIVGTAGSTLAVLAGAAAAMLLLACVNVAGLLLGRAAVRSREVGVRAAIGATRWRVARQLLVESLVLAAAGGTLGIGLAYAAVGALARFGPADLPRLQMVEINSVVLAGSVSATVLSALLFGLAPALRLAHIGLGDALKEGGRAVAGSAHQRLRRGLSAVQVALAFVLVVSGGLLLRSFATMLSEPPGFAPGGAITAIVQLPGARYTRPAATAFFQRAAERIGALPGVRAVAFSSDLPWTGYDENTSFDIAGRTFPDREGPGARYHFITPGYTRALGTALVAGRDLAPSDVEKAPRVVLLNESAARKYWTTPEAAIGARLDLWGAERTVAGVIGDVRDMPWHERAAPALYFPQGQEWQPQPMFLIVRSDVEPASLVDDLRRSIADLDPELPLATVRPLEVVAGAAMATRRLTLWLVGTFGLTALLLAVVGIYGVMAQAVGQRQHEFGVRQALGATGGDIMRLVMAGGAVMAVAGLAAGFVLAIAATRQLSSLLYGVTPLDPATFAGVALVLAAAAGVAAYLPARRASRVSAATALREIY